MRSAAFDFVVLAGAFVIGSPQASAEAQNRRLR
jgi:hypothetical protein